MLWRYYKPGFLVRTRVADKFTVEATENVIALVPHCDEREYRFLQPLRYVLRNITERLEKSVLPLITMGDKGYDVLGRFYREFIRYAGTDKKSGLVITPQHITELFGDIVDINANDVVYDSCCG